MSNQPRAQRAGEAPFPLQVVGAVLSLVFWEALFPDARSFFFEVIRFFGGFLAGTVVADLIWRLARVGLSDRDGGEVPAGTPSWRAQLAGCAAWFASPLLAIAGPLSVDVAMSVGCAALVACVVLARTLMRKADGLR